jgi:hypothetical protein
MSRYQQPSRLSYCGVKPIKVIDQQVGKQRVLNIRDADDLIEVKIEGQKVPEPVGCWLVRKEDSAAKRVIPECAVGSSLSPN